MLFLAAILMPAQHHKLVWHQGRARGPTGSPDAFSEHASSALADEAHWWHDIDRSW